MRVSRSWAPVVIFGLGSLLILGVGRQAHLELEGDLAAAVPARLWGLEGSDLEIEPWEVEEAGMDVYLLRSFTAPGDRPSVVPGADPPENPSERPSERPSGGGGVGDSDAVAATAVAPSSAGAPPFSLYVGYYGSQAQGRTIHSPKNCLPGSGWEVLHERRATVMAGGTEVPVNRYLLQQEGARVLVLYWYQGRGRVEADEYRVKLDLLRDSALRKRSDEALVRIVMPVRTTEEDAFRAASRVAGEIIPAVYSVLPG